MSREIYFICSTPGTQGNLIGTMLRNLLDTGDNTTFLNGHTFLADKPDVMTSEFFYTNIQIPETGKHIINVSFRPDYATLTSRFPECKIFVITHNLLDITQIALSLFYRYFVDCYTVGAEPFFRNILNQHPNLFSNTNAHVTELTESERRTFVKIVEYQKLMDGFYCLTVPQSNNVFELKYKEFINNAALTKQKISTATGRQFDRRTEDIYSGIIRWHFAEFFNSQYRFDTPVAADEQTSGLKLGHLGYTDTQNS
jgi:hypothetical protein